MEKSKIAEDLVKGIGIPSQMEIVVAINEELGKKDCNFGKLADLISQDVSVTAKVLKIANSPFFSSRQVDTIDHALNLIGVTNFTNVIMASALREVMQSCCLADDNFWSHSMFTAKVSSMVAKKTKAMPDNQAYLLGLFHDCAIPVLLNKFPEFIQIIDQAIHFNPDSVEREDNLMQTDHCTVGSMLAKSWRLPDVIYQTIQCHHEKKGGHKNPAVKKAMAVLVFAEYISSSYKQESFKVNANHNWGVRYEDTLTDLTIDEDDVKDLIEDSFESLNKVNPFIMGSKR